MACFLCVQVAEEGEEEVALAEAEVAVADSEVEVAVAADLEVVEAVAAAGEGLAEVEVAVVAADQTEEAAAVLTGIDPTKATKLHLFGFTRSSYIKATSLFYCDLCKLLNDPVLSFCYVLFLCCRRCNFLLAITNEGRFQ